MGHCLSRDTSSAVNTVAIIAVGDRNGGDDQTDVAVNGNGVVAVAETEAEAEYRHGSSSSKNTPVRSFMASPSPNPYPAGIRPSPSPARATPRRFWPFPPPSPAKPILTMLRRRGRGKKQKQGTIQEDGEDEVGEGVTATTTTLNKTFEYASNFGARFELGKEVGRGHFGHTCWAEGKKGELKGQPVAVKIISKDKMTTAIAIEDVRREVKILKALAGHNNLIKFYDSFEDANNVYVVMELCEGGELLDRIISRGGRYKEEDAKGIVVQILSVIAYCHLQGVVHRDLKPENFLFSTKDEDAPMKVIDFGLSDFIRPDQRLNDIVGSAYYVSPEVLHRSYSVEADMWSIGVIVYILLCGSRPFWARTESGIFRSVLRADPNFNDSPWPSVTPEAKDFVKRLLNKDYRKRMSAAQAVTHPWLRSEHLTVPLDILVYKLVKSYIRATPFKRAALKALSKALTDNELVYLMAQFQLLEPKEGFISFENFRVALAKNATDAMKDSRVPDILNLLEPLSSKKLDFEEFCAAATSVYQLEALENWEEIANTAFEYFEQEGNRPTSVEELAQEMSLGHNTHHLLQDCIRASDRKLSLTGYTKFLHGITVRSNSQARHR